mgnify:CR=1 FL=1
MEKLNVSLILPYDTECRFLLQHRTANAERLPDHWAFFGGGINANETPEEAIIREALEELNYEPQNLEMVLERDFFLDGVPGYMHVFIEPYHDDKSKLRLCEGQGWGWFRSSEVKNLKMIDHDRHIVEYVAQYLNNRSARKKNELQN